jgi:putative membrane protein
MKILLRWIINAVAIAVTVMVVPGISGGEANNALNIDPVTLIAVALIFGLVNALLRPILKLLSCPLVLLTLGLFIFVINAAMLLLTSAIAQSLGLKFYVNGFIPALIGSIIISLISIVLNLFIRDED